MNTAIIFSPIGFLWLEANDQALIRIEFLGLNAKVCAPTTVVLQQAAHELSAWFADPLFQFTVPFSLIGTVFRQQVWSQIAKIPPGQVITYADIARSIHSAPRAVGGACGANPLPIIIPCHRVVAAHGLGGFNAQKDGVDWLPIKRWLLSHEQTICH